MIDIQSQTDSRQIDIDQVGIRGLDYPVTVVLKTAEEQPVVASFTLSVRLPSHMKGTHMSRFIEVLKRHRTRLSPASFPHLVAEVASRLEAPHARTIARFPLFLERAAPQSGAKALVRYTCWFQGESDSQRSEVILGVEVPVTTLCPCSKAVSDYGAHNQRGYITIEARTTEPIGFEDLIEVAESSGSAPIYSLLKREDERHVTMQAYDNPVFVEDMIRNVASKLQGDTRVTWFRATCVNRESIHHHDAFAEIEWERPATGSR